MTQLHEIQAISGPEAKVGRNFDSHMPAQRAVRGLEATFLRKLRRQLVLTCQSRRPWAPQDWDSSLLSDRILQSRISPYSTCLHLQFSKILGISMNGKQIHVSRRPS